MDAPAAAVSADGKRIAFGWMDMRRKAGDRDVWWRIVREGKPGPESPLDGKLEGAQGHVSVAWDAEGVAYAAWESQGSIRTLRSNRPEASTISREPEASFPSLAVRGTSRIVVYQARSGVYCRSLIE